MKKFGKIALGTFAVLVAVGALSPKNKTKQPDVQTSSPATQTQSTQQPKVTEEPQPEVKAQVTTPKAEPQPTPAPQPAAQVKPQSGCDPNYTPCIPNVSNDLDCSDISTSVRVIGTDRHRFDRDGDGYGCESN